MNERQSSPFEQFSKTPLLEQGYKEACAKQEQYALHEEDFLDLYSVEEISRDKNYVAKMESKWDVEMLKKHKQIANVQRATVLEYIIFDQARSGDWYGENVSVIKTTRFDDIVNGSDMALEFDETFEESGSSIKKLSHLGLAIDISFGEDLKKKFSDIRGEIDGGRLSEIKYFKSEHSGPQKLEHLPRVVIACDHKTVDELMELWIKKDSESLHRHPFILQSLEEIIGQLKVFKIYAQEVVENESIVEIYDNVLVLITELRDEKKRSLPANSSRSFDSGYKNIQAGLAETLLKIQGVGALL